MTSRPLALFLLIGQSNMAGRGKLTPEDVQPLPGVRSLNATGEWTAAVDPLHADKPELVGVGPGRSFARTLRQETPHREIGLIPCAVGATSLAQWQPGGELFENAVTRTHRAMADGLLEGMLWHQGEGDAMREENAKTYASRWRVMMDEFRRRLSAPQVPVVVGELGEFLFGRGDNLFPFADEVNRQLAALAAEDARVGCVRSAQLDHLGDELHFSAAAQHELGRRYAREFLRLTARAHLS